MLVHRVHRLVTRYWAAVPTGLVYYADEFETRKTATVLVFSFLAGLQTYGPYRSKVKNPL